MTRSPDAGGRTDSFLRYVAVPEKYLTPSTDIAVQDLSAGNVTQSGASHPAGNRTSQAPVTSSAAGGSAETFLSVPSAAFSSAESGCHASRRPSRHSQSGGSATVAPLCGISRVSPSGRVRVTFSPS